MKLISFLFSLCLFLVYLLNHRDKREEETQQPEKQIIVTEEEKAYIGGDFYSSRLKTLQKMLLAARQEEEREQAKLDHINTLNQYGIIVNAKNVKRAEADLYKAQRKRLAIENQIYIAEQRRRKENEH